MSYKGFCPIHQLPYYEGVCPQCALTEDKKIQPAPHERARSLLTTRLQ